MEVFPTPVPTPSNQYVNTSNVMDNDVIDTLETMEVDIAASMDTKPKRKASNPFKMIMKSLKLLLLCLSYQRRRKMREIKMIMIYIIWNSILNIIIGAVMLYHCKTQAPTTPCAPSCSSVSMNILNYTIDDPICSAALDPNLVEVSILNPS